MFLTERFKLHYSFITASFEQVKSLLGADHEITNKTEASSLGKL